MGMSGGDGAKCVKDGPPLAVIDLQACEVKVHNFALELEGLGKSVLVKHGGR